MVRIFSNPTVDAKYRKLGFTLYDLALRLSVGGVSVSAIEHPFKGVQLTFKSITPRTMSLYDVSLPEKCTLEQIAGLIYLNVVTNHPEATTAWRAYFESLGVPLFQ